MVPSHDNNLAQLQLSSRAMACVRRTIRRVLTQEELYSGNRESLRMAFLSRESILWWVITTFHRRRKRYRQLFDMRHLPSWYT